MKARGHGGQRSSLRCLCSELAVASLCPPTSAGRECDLGATVFPGQEARGCGVPLARFQRQSREKANTPAASGEARVKIRETHEKTRGPDHSPRRTPGARTGHGRRLLEWTSICTCQLDGAGGRLAALLAALSSSALAGLCWAPRRGRGTAVSFLLQVRVSVGGMRPPKSSCWSLELPLSFSVVQVGPDVEQERHREAALHHHVQPGCWVISPSGLGAPIPK